MSIDEKMYKEAISELKKAEENMDNAEPDFVDVAILEYNAKRSKVDALLRQIKKEGVISNVS